LLIMTTEPHLQQFVSTLQSVLSTPTYGSRLSASRQPEPTRPSSTLLNRLVEGLQRATFYNSNSSQILELNKFNEVYQKTLMNSSQFAHHQQMVSIEKITSQCIVENPNCPEELVDTRKVIALLRNGKTPTK
jgi:hypothetical protein